VKIDSRDFLTISRFKRHIFK